MTDPVRDRDPGLNHADVSSVLELLAVAPHALGGLVLRAWPGPVRDRVCAELAQLLGPDAASVRVPLHVTDDRLLGGLSLAASLQEGRALVERGLLAAADGGMLVVASAERLEARRVAALCNVLDRASIALERDGISSAVPSRAGVLAVDEGLDDEQVSASLRDRLAFHLDLTSLPLSAAERVVGDAAAVARAEGVLLPAAAERRASSRSVDMTARCSRVLRAQRCWARVTVEERWVSALCDGAAALGVVSLRASLLAAQVAQVHASLAGRDSADEEDVLVAARWVLGPRATQLPPDADNAPDTSTEQPSRDEPTVEEAPSLDALQELVVAAAKSGIPRQLFDSLNGACAARPVAARSLHGSGGKAGAPHAAHGGGRPTGVRAAPPSAAERLNVIETLRAAAPWQRLRGRRPGYSRVLLRKDDLRVTRFERRSETTVIFSVDASGSAALQRLAEAKGAVEQLLIDCYARRDHVALVAFRERAASLLLAPTRSLTRVRKSLAQLAGGGATPLASGIDAASALALTARKHGSLPIVVLMTDARANVARDGEHGSSTAMQDALAAARELRAHVIASLFLDTSPRPREQAQRLAAELGAVYLPLPYLDAAGISAEVRALSMACRSRGA